MNGVSEGRVHHDSQLLESNMFKLATEPSSIRPCFIPLGCGVVSAGLRVEHTSATKGSTLHRLTSNDERKGILRI